MKKFKKLIIACDGESASGKSTAAKLISKKYKLLLINSGLLYRYASKEIIKNNPKDIVNLNNNIILKNSDIGTLGNKISKVDFIDKSIVKVITNNNIEKKKNI